MSLTMPTDPVLLATAVSDSLVVASDPEARKASIFFWERGQPYLRALVDAITESTDPKLRDLAEALQRDPNLPAPYWSLRTYLETVTSTTSVENLFVLGWNAECNSRIGYHLGAEYTASGTQLRAEDLLSLQHPEEHGADDAEVLIVIPFRERGTEPWRLRNLLACLHALGNQSVPRDAYRIVVVESDDQPRWRLSIEPHVDQYLFAFKSGLFNKSWAVNVGVVNTPGQPETICILDADVLPDRDFIARNAARFRRPGSMGHLTYRDMWCLDEQSTSFAIDQRLRARTREAPLEHLRAFALRRPPGCCVWARASAYHRIGGMDERFEGWGGEDNDFADRMRIHAAFDSYDDVLLHLHHPPSSALREDGEIVNAHIPPLSWPTDAEIGNPNRFRGPDAAGPLPR
jgi:hypothetical protein